MADLRFLTVLLVLTIFQCGSGEWSFLDDTWYLSSHGSDTATCGHNISTACMTLDWLLGRFEKTSNMTNLLLSLITDINLRIDSQLVVGFECFYICFFCQKIKCLQYIPHTYPLQKGTWAFQKDGPWHLLIQLQFLRFEPNC